jgi:hypothetical protein
MSDPRRHHYIPVFHLKNFAHPVSGDLFVYEAGKLPRRSSPRAEAVIKDFYSVQINGQRNVAAEYELQKVESSVASVISELIGNEATKERRLIRSDEKELLGRYVGLAFARVPAFMELNEKFIRTAVKKTLSEMALSPEEFHQVLGDHLQHLPLTDELIEATRQHILNGVLEQPDPPELRLEEMFFDGKLLATHLEQFTCAIIRAPRHEDFITGDVPLFTGILGGGIADLGVGFDHPEVEVWFPISRKLCLRWSRKILNEYGQLPPRGVRIVNRNIMRFCRRFVCSARLNERMSAEFSKLCGVIRLGENAFIPVIHK